MDQQQLDRAPVVVRFAGLDPQDFEQELERRWDAIEAIRSNLTPSIVAEVKRGAITPTEGLAIYSCLTGQLLGHAQFHGNATGADMVTALTSGIGERSFAGSRS